MRTVDVRDNAVQSAWQRLTPPVRVLRLATAAVLTTAFLYGPHGLQWAGPPFAFDIGLIYALVALGVTVLGWIGEISLAVPAQMGLALVALDWLQNHTHIPFPLVIVLVLVSSIPVSLVLGLFVLRLRGIDFVVASLAVAYLVQRSVIQPYLGSGGTRLAIHRPSYIARDSQMYYMMQVTVGVVAAGCYLLRRSRLGKAIRAMQDSEAGFWTLGHSPAAYKLFVVCLSGVFATLGGAFFAILEKPNALYYNPGLGIQFFGFALAGGLGSIGGALGSGLFFGALPKYLETGTQSKFTQYDFFFYGFGTLLIIMALPGHSLAGAARRGWARLERLLGGKPAAEPAPETTVELTEAVPMERAAPAVSRNGQAPARREPAELLSVEGMRISFGGVQALNEVSLSADRGVITAVIGPNGAGKTTLFNCLSGLLMPNAGRVVFDGRELRGGPRTRARRGLGRTFQTPRQFRSLSVLDNLVLGCETADSAHRPYHFDPALDGIPWPERAARIARLVGYNGELGVPAGSLAFGDLRLVELARTLCAAPTAILADEPASGLDLQQADHLGLILRSLADAGLAIVLIEHDMGLVMQISERITVLDFGVVIAAGTPDEIQDSTEVVEAYLGRTQEAMVGERQ